MCLESIDFDGFQRTDRKMLLDAFSFICYGKVVQASALFEELRKTCDRLISLQIITSDYRLQLLPSSETKASSLLLTAKEKKYKLHSGTELNRQGELSIGASASIFNLTGRGEQLKLDTSFGRESATPFMVMFCWLIFQDFSFRYLSKF